jgi:hypothetical protein
MDGHCIDGNGSAGIERFTDNRATLRLKGDLAESVVGSGAGGFRLQDRSAKRDSDKPWVFWHCYWSRKNGRFIEGPYGDRKKLMKRLCVKAGVRYFRFHPIRHSGASIMDGRNVPLGADTADTWA